MTSTFQLIKVRPRPVFLALKLPSFLVICPLYQVDRTELFLVVCGRSVVPNLTRKCPFPESEGLCSLYSGLLTFYLRIQDSTFLNL
jgi:hypothetical protein